MSLHQNLHFYISDRTYSVVSSDRDGKTLQVDRHTGQLSLLNSFSPPEKYENSLSIMGVYGFITLANSEYIILITSGTRITTLFSSPIFQALDYVVYPISTTPVKDLLSSKEEKTLLGLLKSHLYGGQRFYFSYGYDVTTRLQEQSLQPGNVWDRRDDRFFWNKFLQTKLLNFSSNPATQAARRFVLPVILGYVNFKTSSINGHPLHYGLISRRSRNRAGTRYFSRGVDSKGNVSNFNETEMITIMDKPPATTNQIKGELVFSYVQTRGSVPIFWAEVNTLKYKPKLQIIQDRNTNDAFLRHLDYEVAQYGDQHLINLVNHKGHELPVKHSFEQAVQVANHPRVFYRYFDFHTHTKGLRFDRVQLLIDEMQGELIQQGYFFRDTTMGAASQRTQTSVCRTNCMDCLDRTNVVQTAIALWVLNRQLQSVEVLKGNETVENQPQFMHWFRNLWADNADVISTVYSGTGALKTDFTRTGKRTIWGNVQDGQNSVMRYIKNNLFDGARQDAFDLITGQWKPGRASTWMVDTRPLFIQIMPWICAIAIFLFLFSSSIPGITYGNVYYIPVAKLFYLIVTILTARFIFANGMDYVSWPRLVPLHHHIEYQKKKEKERGTKGVHAISRNRKTQSIEIELGHKQRID